MNDGSKNVPFALPDEEEEDVFSSVEVEREDDVLTSSPPADGGPTPAVSGGKVRQRNGRPAPSPGPASSPSIEPMLKVEGPGLPGPKAVPVNRPVFNIGRDKAHLALKDEFVSKWHAQIRIEDDILILTDLGSQNGVFLRIADDLQLEDHDEIICGKQRFIFRTTWDPPTPPQTPNAPRTPALGGNLPADSARLIQMYSGGQIGSVSRIKDRLLIGRQNADVVEPDDADLSNTHATIERRNGQFFIKDNGSQQGTFIRVLDSVELIDGDCFIVGRSRISVSYQ